MQPNIAPAMPHLTPTEQRLLTQPDLHQARAQLLHKLEAALLHLQEAAAARYAPLQASLPPGTDMHGRLNKGEHYGPYPYQVADVPRLFTKGGPWCTLRHMVVPGRYCTLQLLVLGAPWQQVKGRLQELPPGWQLATAEDPWAWDPEEPYMPPGDELPQSVATRPWGKLARWWQPQELEAFLQEAPAAGEALLRSIFVP